MECSHFHCRPVEQLCRLGHTHQMHQIHNSRHRHRHMPSNLGKKQQTGTLQGTMGMTRVELAGSTGGNNSRTVTEVEIAL